MTTEETIVYQAPESPLSARGTISTSQEASFEVIQPSSSSALVNDVRVSALLAMISSEIMKSITFYYVFATPLVSSSSEEARVSTTLSASGVQQVPTLTEQFATTDVAALYTVSSETIAYESSTLDTTIYETMLVYESTVIEKIESQAPL